MNDVVMNRATSAAAGPRRDSTPTSARSTVTSSASRKPMAIVVGLAGAGPFPLAAWPGGRMAARSARARA